MVFDVGAFYLLFFQAIHQGYHEYNLSVTVIYCLRMTKAGINKVIIDAAKTEV